MFWLCYRIESRVDVIIQRASSLIQARIIAAIANIDEGEFTEGHQLDPKMARRVPEDMIGKRLSATQVAEALRLLDH